MIDMDNELTKKMGEFLQKETPTDNEIREAALMLLQLDPGRERAIYNSAQLRPQSLLPWVRTDLKKFYGIRMRGMTNEEAHKFNDETVKLVVEDLKKVPEGAEIKLEDSVKMESIRGKREDHDSLPDEIKQLWDKNAERWNTMRKLHVQLEQLIAQPGYQACDGNELCYQLRQADNALRADYKKYDEYNAEEQHQETPEEAAARINKQINGARVYISRHVNNEELTDDEETTLQDAIDLLANLKQNVKPETLDKLKAKGVTIPDYYSTPSSDEQGTEGE